MATQKSSQNSLLLVITFAIIAVAIAGMYMMQDHRSSGERVGDAIEAVPEGLDTAANQLGDQPPAKNVERNLGEAEKKINEKVN